MKLVIDKEGDLDQEGDPCDRINTSFKEISAKVAHAQDRVKWKRARPIGQKLEIVDSKIM